MYEITGKSIDPKSKDKRKINKSKKRKMSEKKKKNEGGKRVERSIEEVQTSK